MPFEYPIILTLLAKYYFFLVFLNQVLFYYPFCDIPFTNICDMQQIIRLALNTPPILLHKQVSLTKNEEGFLHFQQFSIDVLATEI